jgi:hypothetical protein
VLVVFPVLNQLVRLAWGALCMAWWKQALPGFAFGYLAPFAWCALVCVPVVASYSTETLALTSMQQWDAVLCYVLCCW